MFIIFVFLSIAIPITLSLCNLQIRSGYLTSGIYWHNLGLETLL